jgi:RNA polymerase sigma factor (sigma-70 family)
MPIQDESCLTDWFTRWRRPLRQFLVARGVHTVADWEDVFQEVFLRLLRYDSQVNVQCPRAYVFKVASNVVAEWAMRAQHRFEHQPYWLDTLAIEDRREELLDSAVVHGEVQRAVNTLSERARTILRLHFEEDLSHADIAQRLGLSLRIVRRDFEKSYIKLRREVKLEFTDALLHGYN